jgi:chitin synthase
MIGQAYPWRNSVPSLLPSAGPPLARLLALLYPPSLHSLALLHFLTLSETFHMAYNQQHQPYDHYNHIVPDPLPQTTQYAQPAGGYQQQQQQQPQHGYAPNQHQYDDPNANWDAKSYKSYNSQYGGSQAHLNPQYEVPYQAPPMPAGQYGQGQGYQQGYAQSQGYPPQGPGMQRGYSAGYTEAQEKMLRRRSVRQVELQQGNLVLDVQVPSHIVPAGETSEERTKMRYTAATCDPDDFMRSKYSLRPYLYGRQTELFIVMTMCVLSPLFTPRLRPMR